MTATPAAPPRQPVSTRLLWFSRIMSWLCWLGIAASIGFRLLNLFGVIPTSDTPSNPMDTLIAHSTLDVLPPHPGEPPLPPAPDVKDDAFYIATRFIPLVLTVFALFSARSVFVNIGRGEFFARSTSLGLRNLSLAVLLNMTAAPLITTLAHAVYAMRMKARGYHGELDFQFGLSNTTLLVLIFAGTVAIIASVMAHAARVAEENEQFV